VPIDVVKSPSGSTQPTPVDIVDQQGLGTPASVNNVVSISVIRSW